LISKKPYLMSKNKQMDSKHIRKYSRKRVGIWVFQFLQLEKRMSLKTIIQVTRASMLLIVGTNRWIKEKWVSGKSSIRIMGLNLCHPPY